MSDVVRASAWTSLRRVWDRIFVYLPVLMMGLMAMSTYWLVRNTPLLGDAAQDGSPRHEPDYFMQDFSVRVFGADGKLKSEVLGVEGRHFPDTDTLEIVQPRIRILGSEGKLTTATARKGLVNSDGSEAQLFGRAVVVREASTNALGQVTPRSEMQSEFLHLFANTEQVRSHLPVVLLRGGGDRFTADALNYDNLDRLMKLKGRVRGTLQPPKEKK
jgi:lipopolysaccharide export system protein LptC